MNFAITKMRYFCLLLWFVAVSSSNGATTRNYFEICNATTNIVMIQYLPGAGYSAVPQQTTLRLAGIPEGITAVKVWLVDSADGSLRGDYFTSSVWPANSVRVTWSPSVLGGFEHFEQEDSNYDGAGLGLLDLNQAELADYEWCFGEGLIAGSSLAAILLGIRLVKRALSWVDGGNE